MLYTIVQLMNCLIYLHDQQNRNGSKQVILYSTRSVRAVLENIEFNKIKDEHNANLVREFSESRVRKVVWECDSDKSLVPSE